MTAAYLRPAQKHQKGRQQHGRQGCSSSSTSSLCALGKLKKGRATEQPSSHDVRSNKHILSASSRTQSASTSSLASRSSRAAAVAGSATSAADGAAPSAGNSSSSSRGQGGSRGANEIIKEYMEKKFFTKFRPQRPQQLRMRCGGVQQRQQQQLVIPVRKDEAVNGGKRSRPKIQKKKRFVQSEKNMMILPASKSHALQKVCHEVLAELGI